MSEVHLNDLIDDARAEVRDRWANYRAEFGPRADELHDVIHEVADSSVPVYTSDLLALANEDNGLATDEPELGPAFDGSPTPTNVIAANVFERIEAALWDEWSKMEDAASETVSAESYIASTRGLIEDAMGSVLNETDNPQSTAWALLSVALDHLEGVEARIL